MTNQDARRADGSEQETDIAIIGMAGRFPGAADVDQFWRNIASGVESISVFSAADLMKAGVSAALIQNPKYVPARGVLRDVESFDAAFFDITATEAVVMDPQHRLLLECAWEALEHAGYPPDRTPGVVGLYAGSSASDHASRVRSRPQLYEMLGGYFTQLGAEPDFVTTRISYKLNLTGPSVAVQTACSTSLVAVHVACQSILSGECDMALAGGVNISSTRNIGYLYQEGGIRSPDGHCRPFDAGAQGTVSGTGLGLVVLKRLADAVNDGDFVHAVIKGSAANNDGHRKVSYTAPSVEGQVRALREALSAANVDPESIAYIETHGTGTLLGDPIEIAALTQFLRETTARKSFCAVGSVKANIGHLSAAAGVAGLIKAVQALEHQLIPPSPYFQRPNPETRLDESPFYVNRSPVSWPATATPRRAGVSSFGIGGTNAHVVLEEAPVRSAPESSRTWQVVTFSGKTASSLDRLADRFARHLDTVDLATLPDVAYTLNTGRTPFTHRRAITCRDRAGAQEALAGRAREHVVNGAAPAAAPSVAFLFPGVGSQYTDMASELYRTEPTFRDDLDRCFDIARAHTDADLRTIVYPTSGTGAPPDDAIDRAGIVNPLVFIVEYCVGRLWSRFGVRPSVLMGHSLGEYAAATLAGVFDLEDAIALVAARGRLIERLPEGAMLAVSIPEDELKAHLTADVSLASVNAPAACVVAGTLSGVADLEDRLQRAGIASRRLKFSHAPHSAMMDPILAEFEDHVRAAHPRVPAIPVVSSMTGTWLEPEEASDPGYWSAHLRRTIRFADGVRQVLEKPDRVLLEIGPGRTMSSLVKRQGAASAGRAVIPTLRVPGEEASDVELLVRGLGRCWVAGVDVEWTRFYADERRQRVPLPTYPFERTRHSLDDLETAAPAPEDRPAASSALAEMMMDQLRLMSVQLDALHG